MQPAAQPADAYRAVFETTLDGILLTGPDGTIYDANPAAALLTGYSAEELAGRDLHRTLHQHADNDSSAGVCPIDHARLFGDAQRIADDCFVRQDGTTFPVHYVSTPIREGADVVGVVVTFRDITAAWEARAELERRYQEAERARSENRAVLEAASEAMVLVSPAGRLLTVNRRFAEFFGKTAEEVVGRVYEDFRDHIERAFSDPDSFRHRVAHTAADPQQRFTEIVLQKWPEPRELELYSAPVPTSTGDHLGRLYVFRDVTREREVDRMKTEFVSLVSHELRTPLTSIRGYVDLLLEGEVGDVSDDQREFLQIVRNNAERLVTLINDLLDVSRIEAGKSELHRIPLDLGRSIETAVTALRPQFEEKNQTLTVDVADDFPRVLGDPDRVIQIITNLISNAHKYTPRGGWIQITAWVDNGSARVTVTDTGIGLTPEEQAHLFTKFYRARNRSTQEAGGTGLGLSISRSLVEMLGGQMMVASQPGQGSTFSFSLPLANAESEADAAPRRDRPTGGRVLVVEDESDIAALLQRYLERGGYEVVVASSGTEAFRLVQSEPFDLVTLDIRLGDVDGYTVLEWIRSNADLANLPVLLISMIPDERRPGLLGGVDYLPKPVRENILLERVAAILSQERPAKVLVADDDPDVRGLIATHLRRAGYQVLEAADGLEAVELAQGERPCLLLVDLRMPRLDGLGVLQSVRADPHTRNLPVIMMTASPGLLGEQQTAIEDLGSTILLSKPGSARELADLIATGLRRISLAGGTTPTGTT